MSEMHELANAKPVAVDSEDATQLSLNRQAIRKERTVLILPYIGIVLLTVFFVITTQGRFLEVANLRLLLNQCFTMVIIMTGAAFLYSLGNLDMAVGAVMSMAALVISLLYSKGAPLFISLLAGVVVSAVFMSITAIAKSYLKVNPFIASLCVMNICQGIVLAANKISKVSFPYSKAPWLDNSLTKVVVLAVLIAAGYLLFNYTAYGKSLKAVGGNSTVAHISGIKV